MELQEFNDRENMVGPYQRNRRGDEDRRSDFDRRNSRGGILELRAREAGVYPPRRAQSRRDIDKNFNPSFFEKHIAPNSGRITLLLATLGIAGLLYSCSADASNIGDYNTPYQLEEVPLEYNSRQGIESRLK